VAFAIRHHVELRVEAHILVCFLAYCLSVTLRKRLQAHAPGLTPRAVLETLSGILMLDVHLPLADGRELVLPRYTQPEPEHRLVLEKLGWELPPQPPPRIRLRPGAGGGERNRDETENVVETFWMIGLQTNALRLRPPLNHEISANAWTLLPPLLQKSHP
jgi:hypothetical protein